MYPHIAQIHAWTGDRVDFLYIIALGSASTLTVKFSSAPAALTLSTTIARWITELDPHFAHCSTFSIEEDPVRLRRLPFDFDSSPLLEKKQRCGIVEVRVAIFGGHIVNLFHGFKRRQFHSRFFRGLERQSDVLPHEPQRKIRSEITPHHKRRLIFDNARFHHR